jgi:hypothetical protein
MILDWVSFLAYPNLFGIKGFVVVVFAYYLGKKTNLTKLPRMNLNISILEISRKFI